MNQAQNKVKIISLYCRLIITAIEIALIDCKYKVETELNDRIANFIFQYHDGSELYIDTTGKVYSDIDNQCMIY